MVDEKDREIFLGKNSIRLGEDDIFYLTLVGDIDEKLALEISEAIFELNRRFGKKRRNSLDDINKTGNVSSEARRIFRDLTKDEEIGGGKGAIFGLHPVARVLASFFIGSQTKNQRYFKTRDEALAWLKE